MSSPSGSEEFLRVDHTEADEVKENDLAADIPAPASAATPRTPTADEPRAQPEPEAEPSPASGPAPTPTAPPAPVEADGTDASAKPGQGRMVAAVKQAYTVVHPHVSWDEPVWTGSLLLAALTVFTVIFVLETPLVVCAVYISVVALFLTGVGKQAKPYAPAVGRFLPPAVDDSDFSGHGDVVVDAARVGVTFTLEQYAHFRRLLTWEDSFSSLRALAVLYLLATNTWVFHPNFGLFLIVLLFALPIAYKKNQTTVDKVYADSVAPIAGTVGQHAHTARKQFTPMIAAGAFVGLGAVLYFLGVVSLCSWLFISSLTFVALETLPALRPKSE